MVRARSEPAFVLCAQPWMETSQIAELLTKRYGRVTVVVRGAKRVASRFRGLINPFVPLLVSFSGAGDIKNLTDARWLGGLAPIGAEALVSGFYVNELILRLTMRNDPSLSLFEAYTTVLGDLAMKEGRELSIALRSFEIRLLEELGWGQSAKGEVSEENGLWTVRDGELVLVAALRDAEVQISPATARAVIQGVIQPTNNLREIRDVLRRIIGYYVGERGLKTRKTVEHWSQV